MDIPDDLRYTREHEWTRIDTSKRIVTVGLTDFAQSKLGDIVYVELPEDGSKVETGESFGSVESVKAVSDIISPVDGTVIEVNDALSDSPEALNEDPYGEAWLIRVKYENSSALDELMNASEYARFIASEEEG